MPVGAVADSTNPAHEPKVERYRVLLWEVAASDAAREAGIPSDLPADLKEAIDTWTCGRLR
jgi:hypothetical protein